MPRTRQPDAGEGLRQVHQQFTAALDRLVGEIRQDRSILAAILCGSLSHDTVWSKSDIDLVLVTVDDRKIEAGDAALYADGVNVHAQIVPRAEFRKAVESSLHQSFLHSLIAKGRLLFTHDETIADLFATLATLGERDNAVQLLRAATHALPSIYKAHKWWVTRADLDYTALWILYAATPLAQIEVIGNRQLVDREVIPQAMTLNPSFFRIVYSDLLNARKTPKSVRAALDAIDRYVGGRARTIFSPVLDYLREAGEARSSREIEAHFRRHLNVEGIVTACEYLADQGLVGKASLPIQLTRRSNIQVQELAFFSLR
jgi:predicted nucleotidyltransferase